MHAKRGSGVSTQQSADLVHCMRRVLLACSAAQYASGASRSACKKRLRSLSLSADGSMACTRGSRRPQPHLQQAIEPLKSVAAT